MCFNYLILGTGQFDLDFTNYDISFLLLSLSVKKNNIKFYNNFGSSLYQIKIFKKFSNNFKKGQTTF